MNGERITTIQAAKILNTTQSHIIRLICRGEIPATKFGMCYAIRPEDLKGIKIRRPGRPRKTGKILQ